MKQIFVILSTLAILTTSGQDKTTFLSYNKLMELQGTDYVVASVENSTKLSTESKYLLFINTRTGDSKEIDFPKDAFIEKIEQVKIDSLHINIVLVSATTVNLDGNKSIDWNDPKQVIVCATDGTGKVQVTEDRFFVRTWVVNRQTGVIVITGQLDTNNNGKYDRKDKSQIVLYDLKKMALVKTL